MKPDDSLVTTINANGDCFLLCPTNNAYGAFPSVTSSRRYDSCAVSQQNANWLTPGLSVFGEDWCVGLSQTLRATVGISGSSGHRPPELRPRAVLKVSKLGHFHNLAAWLTFIRSRLCIRYYAELALRGD